MVDIEKLKVGDRVLVEATVVDAPPDRNGELRFQTLSGRRTCDGLFFGLPDAIHSIFPRPLEVGDRVRSVDGSAASAEIMAIVGDFAWVKGDGGSHLTYALTNLERIP